MSNAVADVYAGCGDDEEPSGAETTVFAGAVAAISPRSEVLRLLPSRGRRMVGAWCFADVFGPRPVSGGAAMHVPPHPHTGLQTVSWLAAGAVTHRDSLGNLAEVTPGRVAVMTAGHGIAHSEDVVPASAVLHGAQLWVALSEAERHRPPSFTLHERAPYVDAGGVLAQVFVGAVGDVRAPAQGLTPLLGAELTWSSPGPGRLALETSFEHVLVPLAGQARVDGSAVRVGSAMYLGRARTELEVELDEDARVLLLGGEPFEEEIVMWWNFVAGSHEEIADARQRWNAGGDPRFGEVDYPTAERMAAPALPNVRLRPRGRVR
ncbi:MAG TPA: pirin family protein [Actinomycetes bacterium]|nr:pirin family protein [Actinomycetes bacterium]